MSEIREVLARAMRAQGKADPDEVFAKADTLLDDEPVAQKPEITVEQASLLDVLANDDE